MALEEAQRRLSPFSDGGCSEEKFAALAREGTIFDFTEIGDIEDDIVI